MTRFFLAFLLLFIAGTAQADEQRLASEFAAYEAAYARGDLRAASGHAAVAFEEAAFLYGAGSEQAAPYAAAYVRALIDTFEISQAAQILQDFFNSGTGGTTSFELLFQTGRVSWVSGDFDSARDLFQSALGIAEETYGPDSLESARAHFELGRAYPDYSNPASGDSLRNRLIGTGYPYVKGTEASLNRAETLFAQYPGTVVDQALVGITRGAYELSEGNRRAAGNHISPAIDTLEGLGYMDDYALTIYVDWVATNLTHWSTSRMEQALVRAYEMGGLRHEGDTVPLARTTAVHNRRACIDLSRNETGWALIEYSINEAGQVPRTRVVETNLPDWWIEEQRYQMRQWAFIPAQSGGAPMRVDGIRYRTTVSRGSGC